MVGCPPAQADATPSARGTITVEVTPFTRPSRALRSGADEAAAAYGRFWELPCTLRWVDG